MRWKRRLTNEVLAAIDYMSGMIQAGGAEACQGMDDEKMREAMYHACQAAGEWAAYTLNKRELKKKRK